MDFAPSRAGCFLFCRMEGIVRTTRLLIVAFVVVTTAGYCQSDSASPEDWTHRVRIGGYGLNHDRAEDIVRDAMETHVLGIETDNDITGRYESFLHPTEKLKAIQAVAEKAHAAGNYAFVYIAGLECITAQAEKTAHSFFKDHPDWVQRKKTGEPAVFGGGAAFWIAPGDEDVWISPYAAEWRRIYMERVRQIAATGIDGIYVDIPYWMTHFNGWEDSWASFDDYTVEAFRTKTGLHAKTEIRLGDFSDPGFLRWVDFRIQTLTDFMKEVDAHAKGVNPKCKTIAEIYPGIEEEAVRVGADVYPMYEVVDAIAHEYEWGSGNAMAASKTPLDWLHYMMGMFTFRAFAGGRASWMLSYSWDGERNIDPRDAMRNLSCPNSSPAPIPGMRRVMSCLIPMTSKPAKLFSSGLRNTKRRSTARASPSTPWVSTSRRRRGTISPRSSSSPTSERWRC